MKIIKKIKMGIKFQVIIQKSNSPAKNYPNKVYKVSSHAPRNNMPTKYKKIKIKNA